MSLLGMVLLFTVVRLKRLFDWDGGIVLNGGVIEPGCVIGAGAVVKENMIVPAGSMVVGVPGRLIKTLENSEQTDRDWAAKYVKLARAHLKSDFSIR